MIAGAFAAAIAIGTAGFLAGRGTSPHPGPPAEVVSEPMVAAILPPPEQPRTLGRGDIIALADRAADAFASQLPLPQDIQSLAGRRFELAIPFGCDGPSPADANVPLSWRYDEKAQALRIHVSPATWQAADWGVTLPARTNETVEGFWVSRPWMSSATCPGSSDRAIAPDAQPVTLPGQTLAVAQFNAEAPESQQRAPRSFDVVKRFSPEQLDAARGFRIVLAGRVEKLPDGPPIRCIQPAGSGQRPICLVAASFEDLRVENPSTKDVLAIWSLAKAKRGD